MKQALGGLRCEHNLMSVWVTVVSVKLRQVTLHTENMGRGPDDHMLTLILSFTGVPLP